jgi:hypothetical protein
MTQETITKAIGMITSGYNLNQVAAMLMVDRVALMNAINGASGMYTAPSPTTPKKTKKVEDTPLFEDEPGL